MKRLVLAASVLAALSPLAPASAQYYGGRGGGYYEEDDFRPRRRPRETYREEFRGPPRGPYREEYPGPRGRYVSPPIVRDGFGGGGFAGPPPGRGRSAGQALCATPAGACPSFPYPAGAPCRCQGGGRPGGVIVYR